MNRTLNILKCLLLMVMVGALIVPSATAMNVLSTTLSDDRAGKISQLDISFDLTTGNLMSNGKIKVDFPAGFNISTAINTSNPTTFFGDTYTFTVDGQTAIFTRSGTTDWTPADGSISFSIGNIINPPTLGSKTLTIYTTLASGVLTDSGTASVTIAPGPATHLTFDTISSQVAGTPFTITVTARDQFENMDTTFNDPVATLSNSLGTITPSDINIIDGTGTDSVTITKTGTGNITVTSGIITGASNTFTVTPAELGSFVIATIPNQFDELAFTVTAQAKDKQGNNKTDYNAVNNLTVTPGLPGTVTIVSPSPATVQFVNGVYSGQVTLNVVPDPTPAAPQTGVKLTITNVTLSISKTSNAFSITLPVDLKNSTVVADPAIVIEDGVSTSTITVTVKNGINQQNISGATVVLASDRLWMDSIVPASNTTDSNGQAKFSIQSPYPGKANLTATVWLTEVLKQKPVVTFGFDELLHLEKDWNLVSVPRQLANSAISALGTTKVDGIYYFDTEKNTWKYALYNRTSGTWNGTLTAIDDGKGYWMFASAATNVPVVLKPLGQPPSIPTYPLKAGWNLIGYTSMLTNPSLNLYIDDYFYPDLYYDSMSRFSPIWVSAYEWTDGGFSQTSPGSDSGFSDIVRTKGYWIYLKDDATLVP